MSSLPYNAPLEDDEQCFYGTKHRDTVNPHPDGQPWTKCCDGDPCCAYRRINGKSRASGSTNLKHGELRFFCAHQLADGYNRVCAGWHAVAQGLKLKSQN
jgi:hypothetical protein